MDEKLHMVDEEARILLGQTEIEEYPLPVADDWDELVAKSKTLSQIIDAHLDFEEKLQGINMRPSILCPEQRVSLATDLMHASK